MEKYQAKINTLSALLPQNMPFVVSQVSEAIKLCVDNEDETIVNRNLDIALMVAEQVSKYSQGDLLYAYVPILVALLQDVSPDVSLDKFDTVDHKVLIGLSKVRQFVSTYDKNTKAAPGEIINLKDNYDMSLVILANMLYDIQHGKNALNIAYIIINLNISRMQFVNGTYKFYCDLLSEIAKAEF